MRPLRQDREGDPGGQGSPELLRRADAAARQFPVGEGYPRVRHLYLEWAGKVEAAHLQELLRSFAGEEQGHKEMLEKVMGGGAFQPASAKVSDLKIVDYLVDILPSPDMDYQEALIIAMRREKAAFKLYSDLAAMSGDDETRALFLSLAQEEAKHKLRLETEYEKDIYREN
jgi:rubrerythrin